MNAKSFSDFLLPFFDCILTELNAKKYFPFLFFENSELKISYNLQTEI